MRIAVTGAFGYSGRYIAKRLLEAGHSVITLTNSTQRMNPFGSAMVAHPFHFDQPGKLAESLSGTDTLINNIAWALRHMPVFGVFGSGDYKLQPIYVDDLATTAVEKAMGTGIEVVNAIGPETFTYRELVMTIGQILGCKRPIISIFPGLGYWPFWLVGKLVGDVVVTREEIKGLMEGRLCLDAPPLGMTKLTDWVREQRDRLGRCYTSEMARRVDRVAEYRAN